MDYLLQFPHCMMLLTQSNIVLFIFSISQLVIGKNFRPLVGFTSHNGIMNFFCERYITMIDRTTYPYLEECVTWGDHYWYLSMTLISQLHKLTVNLAPYINISAHTYQNIGVKTYRLLGVDFLQWIRSYNVAKKSLWVGVTNFPLPLDFPQKIKNKKLQCGLGSGDRLSTFQWRHDKIKYTIVGHWYP